MSSTHPPKQQYFLNRTVVSRFHLDPYEVERERKNKLTAAVLTQIAWPPGNQLHCLSENVFWQLPWSSPSTEELCIRAVIPTFHWSGPWCSYCCWFDIVQILLFLSLWSWCISAHTLGFCKTREPLFLWAIATLPAFSISGKTVVSHTGPTQKHQHVCPVSAHTVLFPLKFLKFCAQRCLHSCLVTAWQQQRIQADFLVEKNKPLEKKWMECHSSPSLW